MERSLAHRHHVDHDGRAAQAEHDPAATPVADLSRVVQAKETGGRAVVTDSAEVQSTAAQGVAGAGHELPHLDAIQRSFGPAHDLSTVKAHVGGDGGAAAEAMGAHGFATGSDVAFAKSPDLFLAAHEAAHVVQQREGVHMKGGVGQANDTYEQHADQVAARVVAGESAADLLPAKGPSGGAGAVQFFVEQKVKGQPCRVSETGQTLVMGESNYSQDLYATQALADDANQKLAASGDKGSYLRLAPTGNDLKLGGHTLIHLRPVFKAQGDSNNAALETANQGKGADDKMSLWADCGRSSRAVMGSHGDAAPHATYQVDGKAKETGASYSPSDYSDKIYLDAMPSFLAHPDHGKYLKAGVHYQNGDKSDLIAATSADQARAQYWELGDDGRRAFDQATGINTGANPEVGGGYTMNTEYNMPGFKSMARNTWNFHWAGVVMKDGSDNITLENYADGNGYESVNMDWNYQMYGTVKKGQTFQDEHLSSNTHGSRASAFAVEPKGN
ncbi:MAG: DUF4157 domain-containing protein [Kofleriaceae bacterium]